MKQNLYRLQVLAVIILALTVFSVQATPTTTYYIYDEAGHVIGEYDANGNPIQEHIYLGDRPVAVAVTSGSTTTINYVTTDQLNTPRAVTDGSKNVEWSWSSDPFGNGQPTGSFTYNLRFPGQYADAETGHNYNYFRDYDPETDRYLESDPLGLSGGSFSTYLYAANDPSSVSDPLGLWVKICSRLLGNAKSAATGRWNPIRHDYLDVSGKFIGFYSAAGANPMWGRGVVAGSNESDSGRCSPLCDDDKFDSYVLAAAAEIGAPTYCAIASADFGLQGLAAEAAGARNCQSWARDVIAKAKQEYLAHEKCPKCFK